VRHISATLLLAFFAVLFTLPLLADGADASLPACCRSQGKHHCLMSASERRALQSSEPAFAQVSEKCPYNPASPIATRGNTYQPSLSAAVFGEVLADAAPHTRTETNQRTAFDRSRPKRGPPAPFLSA
jgi:hypothetical protein